MQSMRGSEVHEGRRSRESVERVGALDGLRGVVIVTVVLNHAVGKLGRAAPATTHPFSEVCCRAAP